MQQSIGGVKNEYTVRNLTRYKMGWDWEYTTRNIYSKVQNGLGMGNILLEIQQGIKWVGNDEYTFLEMQQSNGRYLLECDGKEEMCIVFSMAVFFIEQNIIIN